MSKKSSCNIKRCKVGGQAVMEGVMMRSEKGVATAVRRSDGSIVSEFHPTEVKYKKGSPLTWPVIRGVVAFIDSLSTGMKTLTESAEMYGEDLSDEEPSKFEKFLADKLGKSVEDIAIAIGVILAIALSLFLFVYLPVQGADLILKNDSKWKAEIVREDMYSYMSELTETGYEEGMTPTEEQEIILNNIDECAEQIEILEAKSYNLEIWRSLIEGALRLVIFIGYLLLISLMKDIKRVFMYHGAEHKTISCYESGDELTPENAMRHTRLHPRCGTNYLFLVMAVSILIFTLISAVFPLNIENAVLRIIARIGIRLLFLPLVAGLSYEVLQAAAKSDNLLCRIVRAPGMGLQLITTREPTPDMIEVALHSFKLAMQSIGEDVDIPYLDKKEEKSTSDDTDDNPTDETPSDDTAETPTDETETPVSADTVSDDIAAANTEDDGE